MVYPNVTTRYATLKIVAILAQIMQTPCGPGQFLSTENRSMPF